MSKKKLIIDVRPQFKDGGALKPRMAVKVVIDGERLQGIVAEVNPLTFKLFYLDDNLNVNTIEVSAADIWYNRVNLEFFSGKK